MKNVKLTLRERALRIALEEAKKGVKEVGGNNRGPAVRAFLREVGLPEGNPWCDAFVSWCLHRAANRHLPFESAGVAVTYGWALRHGWLVDRPLRADLVLFDFNGNGRKDDHIGFVLKVLRLGPVMVLRTVEGNTSSGQAGSQADGGGVYIRTRIVKRGSVAFVRVPGQ